MIKCFIFDLDGTLLDTIGTITYYVNKVIIDEGLSPITEEECKYFAGNGAETLIRRTLKSKGIEDESEVKRILGLYKHEYDSAPLYGTAPYDGIIDVLKNLKKKGILTAVISNKQHEATVPAVRHFLGDLIDVVRGGKDGVPLKPAPDGVYAIMKELDVMSDEVVYVGDTGVDMETGKAFGANRTVGVLWGFRKREELERAGADRIIFAPSELLTEVE